jgi:TetR/AcrR family fatty acid metabolism transcriptional regulator
MMNQYSSVAMKVQPLREKLRETTEAAILDAAELVVGKEGLVGTSLQAIADQAGVAVGTLYNYFTDKDGLMAAMFNRRRQELYEAIDRLGKAQAQEPFAVQVAGFVRAVFAHFDARPAYLRVVLEVDPARMKAEAGGARGRPAMQQLKDRAERIIGTGVLEKQLREEGSDLFATVLVSLVRGVLLERARQGQPLEPEAQRTVDLFLHGAAR